ncbi:maleylpyruvate isomerase N-terminal domain-containing protein [Pseudonocardia kunmingensis]|nr:maleylpyruvate isomerase N-terminal domain-containing protein [Pseudonocardia kunmingensis]
MSSPMITAASPLLDAQDYAEIMRRAAARLRHEGSGALDLAVPACPGWKVRNLLFHVGHVASYVLACVVARGPQPDYRDPEPPPDTQLCDWMSEQVATVQARMAQTPPAAPAWNWSTGPQTASFWPRHLAHEAQIHLWDLHDALGRAAGSGAPPRTTALAHLGAASLAAVAVDGVDEILRLHLPARRRDEAALPGHGHARLVAVDVGIGWDVDLANDSVRSYEVGAEPVDAPAVAEGRVVLQGTAEVLYLALWGRVPLPLPAGTPPGARRIGAALVSG